MAAGGLITLTKGDFNLAAQVAVDKHAVHIRGQGMGATTVLTTLVGMNGFVFGNGGAPKRLAGSLSHMTIDAAAGVVKNAGAAILLNGADEWEIDKIFISRQFNGILLDNNSVGDRLTNLVIANTIAATGTSIILQGLCDNVFLSKIIADTAGSGNCLAGLAAPNCNNFIMTDCSFIRQGIGMSLAPGNGQICTHSSIENSYFDNNSFMALYINPAGGGVVAGIIFTSSWFASSGAAGHNVLTAGAGTVDGLSFAHCRSLLAQHHGFVFTVGQHIELDACKAYGNSAAVNNVEDGIYFGGACSNFAVRNCNSGPYGNYGATQAAGCRVIVGANNYVIVGNNLRSNLTGALIDGGGPNKTVANNLVV